MKLKTASPYGHIRAEAQLRAGVYARLSELYDAAESVPTQLERGTDHATRRGWTVAATFKDDGFSGFKEITRDGFGELIAAIEANRVNVVIVRDIDRLTRNLTDWNAFEKACVRLSAYTGGDLDLSTAEGAYYGGMETLRARRESAVKNANLDEPNHKKRHILREEINPVEAEAIQDFLGWPLGRGDEGYGGDAAEPGDRVGVAHRLGRVVGQLGVFIDDDHQGRHGG